MAMTYATVTGRIVIPGTATGIPGELHALPLTEGAVLAFPLEDTVTLGPAVADVAADGTLSQDGTPGIKIPTDVPVGTLWRLVFHPKGKGNLPTRLGDFEITADTTTGDLVPVQVMAITPTVADNIAAAAALGATNDTATASFVNTPGSATDVALKATYARQARALAPLKAMLAEGGKRPVAVQVIGDSTGNEPTEWPRLVLNHIKAAHPEYTVQEAVWNSGTEVMPAPTVLQTGTAGLQYLLVETGKTTPAIPSASAFTFPAVLDLRVKMAADDWTSAAANTTIAARENGAGQRSWWFGISASGVPNIVISSDGTALTTINGGAPVPFADGATGWVRVVYNPNDGAGNRVTKFYTSTDGITWTQLATTITTAGTLVPFNPTNAQLTIGGRGGGSGLPGKIYEVHMLNGENGPDLVPPLPASWPMTPTGTNMSIVGAPVLTLVNGSHPGADAVYLSDSTRLSKMTPNYGQAVIFVSDSHNDVGKTDAAFITSYDAIVTGVLAKHPGVPVVVLTQNPENGAANQYAHSMRRWNLIAYAAAKGHTSLDTYGAFLDSPGGVPALMADTVHPNATGSALWASVVTDAYDVA